MYDLKIYTKRLMYDLMNETREEGSKNKKINKKRKEKKRKINNQRLQTDNY